MTSSRPYLIRALYEWLVDNQHTPYLLVDATVFGTIVPKEHVNNGNIILNLTPEALQDLKMTNKLISFSARFDRGYMECKIPIPAVLAIYSSENGRGMFFNDDDLEDDPISTEVDDIDDDAGDDTDGGGAKGKSHLRIIK